MKKQVESKTARQLLENMRQHKDQLQRRDQQFKQSRAAAVDPRAADNKRSR